MGLMGELGRLAGDDFETYVAQPEGEPRGGLVVIHEIWVWPITSRTWRIALRPRVIWPWRRTC